MGFNGSKCKFYDNADMARMEQKRLNTKNTVKIDSNRAIDPKTLF